MTKLKCKKKKKIPSAVKNIGACFTLKAKEE